MIKNHLQTLLKILSDGQYHSGAVLGEKLGITRAAIWRLIKRLQSMQVNIEAKTNQGYRIPHGLELLSLAQIKKHLAPQQHHLLKKTLHFDQIDSTNNFLLERLRLHDDIRICIAESQTAGRGRFGRQWVSPFGKNIYFSLLWHFNCDLSELSGLSIAIGFALFETLNQYGITQDLALKWPNDVLWQNKKLCGTLIELHGESNHQSSAVIGIGINLEISKNVAETITQPWTDIMQITQTKPQRNKLIALLIENLTSTLAIFQQQGLTPFIKNWKKLDPSYHKTIKIIAGNQIIEGLNQGIDEYGRVLLKDQQGKIHTFSSGEVSLRMDL